MSGHAGKNTQYLLLDASVPLPMVSYGSITANCGVRQPGADPLPCLLLPGRQAGLSLKVYMKSCQVSKLLIIK